MKVTLIPCVLLLLCVAAACQDVQKQCGAHPNLLRDSAGMLKWFTPDEMQSMATKVVRPDPVPLPNGMPYEGFVAVRVMVNTTGDVVCMWEAAGHPVMIPAAIRAIHDWKFKPVEVGSRRVEFVGRLRVPVYAVSKRE